MSLKLLISKLVKLFQSTSSCYLTFKQIHSRNIFGFAPLQRCAHFSRRYFRSVSSRCSKLYFLLLITKNDIEIWYDLKKSKKANERRDVKDIQTVFRVGFSCLSAFGVKKCWFTSFSSSNFNNFYYWWFKWVIKAVKTVHDIIPHQLPVSIAKLYSQLMNLDSKIINFVKKMEK